MKVVGVQELKDRLSEYLRLVSAGERFLLTDHGEVVAELGTPRREATRILSLEWKPLGFKVLPR